MDAFKELMEYNRKMLLELSESDPIRLHSLRRKLWKSLEHDERGSPAKRKRLKKTLLKYQDGKCKCCGKDLGDGKYSELDRKLAYLGYTKENVDLKCQPCHRAKNESNDFH
jgi:hypothetical protein